ncbi:MAG: hypothetical protein LC620_07090 [Halobacteriales archaeon]|nr:hypothetical protein [Halobacteriales archaeon]
MVQVQDQENGGWVDVDVTVVGEKIQLLARGESVGSSEGLWPPGALAHVVQLVEDSVEAARIGRERATQEVIGGPIELTCWVYAVPGQVGVTLMGGGGDSEMVLRPDDAHGLADALRKAVQAACKWNIGNVLLCMPRTWDKRLEDLKPSDHGDGRLSITGEESTWAREFEVRALRPWVRFPRDGDTYEALEDVEVNFLTHWKAPFTGGGTGVLPKGTKVRVSAMHDEPVGVHAQPLDSPGLEAALVPADERGNSKYDGFSLSLGTEVLNRRFRLVPT